MNGGAFSLLTLRTALSNLYKNTNIIIAMAFILIIAVIIIPIRPLVLDLLLVFNITLALVIILVTLFVTEVLQLATFPSVLLVATLFRLALNISSTRLILTEARAGEVINAFGQFVVGGNYVVGLIIFAIITLVQFVVITSGAGRIAEVAARFTLDAMPGKQMSIDADFNAGLINEEEARLRRRNLQREADFYGAMDGASKFVRGDAIAGVVIVLINILGGLAIGMVQRGMDFYTAAETYTILTVGDGLVAQIPALLVSTAAGMLVTRSTAEKGFGEDFISQFFTFPRVLAITAFILFILGLFTPMPFIPFFILAGACGFGAFLLLKEEQAAAKVKKEELVKPEKEIPLPEDDLRSLMKTDLLEIEIGYNLVSLTEKRENGDLLQRITACRRSLSAELGMLIKPIRIRDNLQLHPNAYLIKLKGNEIARGELRPGYLMALNPEEVSADELGGIPTVEPTFNLPAVWIPPAQKGEAELKGCTVVDVNTVLITHLAEVIKSHAHELLGRQEAKEMIDAVKETHPAVVDELIPNLMSIGEIQKVLQNLLRENIPLQDLPTILETLADFAPTTKDTDILTDYVRQSLARTISFRYAEDGKLSVITLDPLLEKRIAESLQQTIHGSFPVLEPETAQRILQGVSKLVEKLRGKGVSPVVLTSPRIRLPFRRMVERYLSDLAVLSFNEILPQLEVESVGVLKEHEN
ncbi:MAG TPA: flagellar biosynthesis protein FlhA [Firmicutes bacterium]|jgi:flagellar biosynthesis protein FlhA|nr:flagellar biosynthesis protein FlhA [Bacillota bacterium]